MKKTFKSAGFLSLFAAVFCIVHGPAAAAEKVVVIPLHSSRSVTTTCTAPDEVLSLGKCWKDRNLGAVKVAEYTHDVNSYGDLYQWGRVGDGHQNRNATTDLGNSPNDIPGHSRFIRNTASPYSWRFPTNSNLWQGLGGVGNPCPQGFRLPTEEEWFNEVSSWSAGGATGAMASPLKLPLAGYRHRGVGDLRSEGSVGVYWSSTVSGNNSIAVTIDDTSAIRAENRAWGFSVRCIKD